MPMLLDEPTVLKITELRTAGSTVLRLEGRLGSAVRPELERACAPLLEGHDPLRLDLAGLQFVDDDGVDCLRGLLRRGVEVVRATAFINQRLKECGS